MKDDNYIRGEIFAAMHQTGITKQNTLARKAGIPTSTLSVHLSNPGRFTIDELRRIGRVVGLTIRLERGL